MNSPVSDQPNYGNWVSTKLIAVPGVLGAILAALSALRLWLAIPALAFLACAAYFAYARHQFSPRGGNVQTQIRAMLLDAIQWDGAGKALDIGCGSGSVTVLVARAHPAAHVTGVDSWGKAWEYSKGVCERNAALEGVGDRVDFQEASAAALPFDDESFDAVVSNLTFHEVSAVRDKAQLIKEALRVLKKGGSFTFQDLIYWKAAYGEVDALVATLRSWGIQDVEVIDKRNAPFIPKALKLPFMAGTLGILRGTK